MAEAVGILEVFGLATAFVAADAGCKAANDHLEVFDKNKPANADRLPVPDLVCSKFRGWVGVVTEAVEAGIRVAESMTGVVQHYVIPNPETGTEKMLKISALDKEQLLRTSEETSIIKMNSHAEHDRYLTASALERT